MKIHLEGAKLFHAGGRTDLTKVIIAFRNFAKAPKNRQIFLAPSVYKIQFIPHREHGMLLLEGPFG